MNYFYFNFVSDVFMGDPNRIIAAPFVKRAAEIAKNRYPDQECWTWTENASRGLMDMEDSDFVSLVFHDCLDPAKDAVGYAIGKQRIYVESMQAVTKQKAAHDHEMLIEHGRSTNFKSRRFIESVISHAMNEYDLDRSRKVLDTMTIEGYGEIIVYATPSPRYHYIPFGVEEKYEDWEAFEEISSSAASCLDCWWRLCESI